MKYKIGDHVIIEESNIDWFENFAGKSGTIVEVGSSQKNLYKVFPDEWSEIVEWRGVWSKVKCLVDNVEDVNSKYLNCKFMLATVPYNVHNYLTEGKIYTMVNGKFENDQGIKWPFTNPIENADDLIAYFNNTRSDVFGKEQCSNKGSARLVIIKED